MKEKKHFIANRNIIHYSMLPIDFVWISYFIRTLKPAIVLSTYYYVCNLVKNN